MVAFSVAVSRPSVSPWSPPLPLYLDEIHPHTCGVQIVCYRLDTSGLSFRSTMVGYSARDHFQQIFSHGLSGELAVTGNHLPPGLT